MKICSECGLPIRHCNAGALLRAAEMLIERGHKLRALDFINGALTENEEWKREHKNSNSVAKRQRANRGD